MIAALCTALCTTKTAQAVQKHSPALTGFLGLNTVPNARMDDPGTLRTGTSALSPYMHGYIGIQIAAPLHINIRQTAETSNILKDAERLYTGIDLKLRLLKERAHLPEIAIGMQSAFGHKRMAGEYIALSKRYKNIDITAGLGWGRFATAAHFDNPLKGLSNHFDKARNLNGEIPNDPSHWFSGDDIGFFAGIEYFTPYDGLSLKLDYGADRYTAETQTANYRPAAPWAIGLAYTHNNWASVGIGMQGTDKIMGRISLQSTPAQWPFTHKKYEKPKPFYKQRPQNTNIHAITLAAQEKNIRLTDIRAHKQSIHATLEINPYTPVPQQIGRAARHIAAHSGQNIEEINMRPKRTNIQNQTVKIIRTDVENALDNHNSSPQEIWNNTEFTATSKDKNSKSPFLSTKGIKHNQSFTIALENHLSLSEEDNGTLYRSAALIKKEASPFLGFLTGSTLRINLIDNLEKIDRLRPAALIPVRSDINAFTRNRISLENAYIGYASSLTPSLHTAATLGYLEEFYSGIGGEILYRPFASRLAFGAELWSVLRRNPYTAFNLGQSGRAITTGHINAWYDIPHHGITLYARAGRYLAGDTGATIGLDKHFKNGAKLTGQVTVTNYSDADLFGGTTSAYHSLNLSLPLGSIPHIPTGSELRTKIAPFGRDIGQSLNPPLQLYEMTTPLTLNHIATHWPKILD